MKSFSSPGDAVSGPGVIRIGSVSYLNAKPLIYGLDQSPGIAMSLDVPSKLIEGLLEEQFDVALLPVIDYQRMENLCVVPSGGIGCDGPTLTVRIFSQVPIDQIHMLACDTDSHTSVALARVVLAERYRLHPQFVDLRHSAVGESDALLLIGDKVVCEEPQGYPHQLDLGEAWKQNTGLPFVFAAWIARQGIDLRHLPQQLTDARIEGLRHVDEIIKKFAVPRGWPADLARQYLTSYLQYHIGPRQLEAIKLFHQLAYKHGALQKPVRPLRLYGIET